MHIVVGIIIRPFTKVHDGIYGYASLLNKDQPQTATVFCSHCWNEHFPDFVSTLDQNVLARNELEPFTPAEEPKQIVLSSANIICNLVGWFLGALGCSTFELFVIFRSLFRPGLGQQLI